MIKKILISITVILLTGLAVSAQNGRKLTFLDGVQAYTNGQYEISGKIFKAIVDKDPSNDAAWYYLGLSTVTTDITGAKNCLRKAMELDPRNFWYKETIARVYMYNRENDLAIALYEKLLEEYPEKTDILYSLANLYLAEGNSEKAVSTIESLESVSGKSDATVMARYNIFRQKNDNENAYKVLKDYVNEYSSPYVLTMLGDYEMGMYNDTTAIAYYDEALSLDRDYAPARIGKAEAYRMTRRYPEYFSSLNSIMSDVALPAASKAEYIKAVLGRSDRRFVQTFTSEIDSVLALGIECHPADTGLVQAAGVFYVQTDRLPEAAAMFLKNAELDTTSVAAAATYVQVLASMEDWDAVVSESERMYARFPKELAFVEMINVAEYNRKNYAAVISNSERIVKSPYADDAAVLRAMSTIGDMQYQTGEVAKAYKTYDAVLKKDPQNLPVLNNYAWYLCTEGKKLGKAYRMSKITVEKEPDNPTYLDTFGWILHLMGRDLEAKPFFKHAMLYGGKESATILRHYGAVLEKLGETDLAKVYYDQADKLPAEKQ